MILALGALLGLIAVVFGAFAEHGLRQSISEEYFRFLMTAIRYNQVHAVVVVAIGLARLNGGVLVNSNILKWSGIILALGTILFSFSIYLSVSANLKVLMNITPIGGITIMVGWLLLCITGLWQAKKKQH